MIEINHNYRTVQEAKANGLPHADGGYHYTLGFNACVEAERCPLWVISGHRRVESTRLLYPSKRMSRCGSIDYTLNCDPRNWPLEKTRQKCPFFGRGLRLSPLFRQNRR